MEEFDELITNWQQIVVKLKALAKENDQKGNSRDAFRVAMQAAYVGILHIGMSNPNHQWSLVRVINKDINQFQDFLRAWHLTTFQQ